MFCKKCGKELAADSKFCAFCGTTIGEEAQPISGKPPKDTSKKKLPKGCVIGCIVLWILAIVGILVSVFGPGGTSDEDLIGMVPKSVNGFHLVSAGKVITREREDLPDSVSNVFEPISTVYLGKVEGLTVQVERYKSEAMCSERFNLITGNGSWTSIAVDGE